MKKILFSCFAVLFAISMLLGLVSCVMVKIQVDFIVDGEVYDSVITYNTEMVKMPDDPTKDWCEFEGWYWDEGVWDKPFTLNSLRDVPLSSNSSVKIYAKFVSTCNSHADDDKNDMCDHYGCGTKYHAVHVDKNDDRICDTYWCETTFDDGHDVHVDVNDDLICDYPKCGLYCFDGHAGNHKDADDDGNCDYPGCDAYGQDGHDVHYDKNDDLLCDFSGCNVYLNDGHDVHYDENDDWLCDFSGCNVYHNDGHDVHFDENSDGECDYVGCGFMMVYREWWNSIVYDETELRFQLTECENSGLHPNTKRLLQGDESASLNRPLDYLITQRNENAYFNTKVSVVYMYYANNAADYGWGKAMDVIYNEVQNMSQYSPDMYCNFMSDMLATSLKGSFANILSESRNSAGAGPVSNYFKVDPTVKNEGYEHSGYMSDLMSSLTLSDEKFYVIASDYFIDLIRAFFVVPVSKTLYDQIAPRFISDLNGDTRVDINDFFEEVVNSDWTYDRLIEYCDAVAVDNNNNASWDYADTLGFALDYDGGMMASGLMYTTSLVIIEKTWDEDEMKYTYAYPDTNPELDVFVGKVNDLFASKGVAAIGQADAGKPAVWAIAEKFVSNEMLFGGIVTLGNLENAEYQEMKNEKGGFGVVPVPVYTNIDPTTGEKYALDSRMYNTQIHTSGAAGGISHITKKFTQCSAFIQYQSTNSTNILNEYYNNNLTADVSGDLEGNVYMLQYIRSNIRTSFDKLFEDAIAFFNRQVDESAQGNRWHNILMRYKYNIPTLTEEYASLIDAKKDRLANLVDEYTKLPD